MQERATVREVAAAARVSKRTAQYAFAHGVSIAEDARRRVLKGAAALNCTPGRPARSVATGPAHPVAVVAEDLANPQEIPFLDVLSDGLQANGLVALTIDISTRFDHVRAVPETDQRRVGAVNPSGAVFRGETPRARRLVPGGAPPRFVLARDSQIDEVPAADRDTGRAIT